MFSEAPSVAPKIAVIGLGFVGLRTCKLFSDGGFPVVGIEIDAGKVSELRSGNEAVSGVSRESIEKMLTNGFSVTTEFEVLVEGNPELL